MATGAGRSAPSGYEPAMLGAGWGSLLGATGGGLGAAHWTQAVKSKGARAALIALGILGGGTAGGVAGYHAGYAASPPSVFQRMRRYLADNPPG